ncbi:MAG: RND family efflux transporter MFP subunit [Candidatus Pseudothioglobus sp.]|jgi:RND family efflux transporter MFP subunit
MPLLLPACSVTNKLCAGVHKVKQLLLPIAILIAGFGLAGVILATGPTLTSKPAEILAPLVRTSIIKPQQVQLGANTHGSVSPRTESEVVPEVAGRVIHVNPDFVSGGFFKAGEELLRIDPLDSEVALEQAKANLARAESDLANASKDASRQDDLVKRKLVSTAAQDDAGNRLRITDANLRQARAQLSRAERDLLRTRIVAPYDGRVRTERVDIGQFVSRGTAIASIYATDYAEVRLPIHDEELAFLNLPLGPNPLPANTGAEVTLSARFGGADHQWQAKVVRTEGELDPKTRMVTVVARVDRPYKIVGDKPPLAVGLFVDARIHGKIADNISIIPRAALHQNNQVLVVDVDDKLHFQDVTILRIIDDQAYISAGLNAGDRLCISVLDNPLEGMSVRTQAINPAAKLSQSAVTNDLVKPS